MPPKGIVIRTKGGCLALTNLGAVAPDSRSGDMGGDRDAPVLRDEIVVHVFDSGGDLRPAKTFGGGTGFAAEAAPERLVVQ